MSSFTVTFTAYVAHIARPISPSPKTTLMPFWLETPLIAQNVPRGVSNTYEHPIMLAY